jgi:GGDEF domain-containing protein
VIEIARRIKRCFEEPFRIEGYVIYGSVSVGFAMYPEDGGTGDTLLTAADASMYKAKQTRQQV